MDRPDSIYCIYIIYIYTHARRFVVVLRWTNYFPDSSNPPNLLRPKIFCPYLYIVIKARYWFTDHTIPDERPDFGRWQFIWWFYDYSFSKSVRGALSNQILISTTTVKIKQTLLQLYRWKSCNELFSSIFISPLSIVLLVQLTKFISNADEPR